MKENQITDESPNKSGSPSDEEILFDSRSYCQDEDTGAMEEDEFNKVMRSIEAVFKPSVLVGVVGLWDGKRDGYKYCEDINELLRVITNDYDDIVIRQIGSGLHFILIHHDGRHEMELRRLTEEGINHSYKLSEPEASEFIKLHSIDFGRIAA
jgi:flavodoxin